MENTSPLMKTHRSAVTSKLIPISGAILALCLSLTSTTAFSREKESIPGLEVEGGGVQRVGTDAIPNGDAKEFQEFEKKGEVGALQFWTWLKGNATALELLMKPNIFPLTHEVSAIEVFRKRPVAVDNIGTEKKTRLLWQREYRRTLQAEIKTNKDGKFVTSALSRCSSEVPAARYQIQFITSEDKVLADGNGKPITIEVATPR
jgi:hypothetical protein